MGKKRPWVEREFIQVLRPCLHFHGIQIKSEEAFRRFARALTEIEEVVGIHEVTISLEDPFICPWIGLEAEGFVTSTPMEELLVKLVSELS